MVQCIGYPTKHDPESGRFRAGENTKHQTVLGELDERLAICGATLTDRLHMFEGCLQRMMPEPTPDDPELGKYAEPPTIGAFDSIHKKIDLIARQIERLAMLVERLDRVG